MGKIVIGDNQNLLLKNGKVIKAKALKLGDEVIGFDAENKKVSAVSVTSIDASDERVHLFSSSHGRIILTSLKTRFQNHKGQTCFEECFDNYDRRNYVYCLLNHALFGTKQLDDKDIEDLRSSIFYLNDKRPNNRSSLTQSIPKLLSELTKDSLIKVLNGVDYVRNLDIYSKDLLIMLLGRLGLNFSGRSTHGSEEITGSIVIPPPCKGCKYPPVPEIKIEKLTPLGDSDMDSLNIEFDSPNVFIGSLLCLTH